jgi:hypothetical protein
MPLPVPVELQDPTELRAGLAPQGAKFDIAGVVTALVRGALRFCG